MIDMRHEWVCVEVRINVKINSISTVSCRCRGVWYVCASVRACVIDTHMK